jgi:hypothetical protein
MSRLLTTCLVLGGLVLGAAPVAAQEQGVSVSLGYFVLRGEDGRPAGDVLNANRCIDVDFLCEPLLFEVGDFNGATVSGEYLFGLGEFTEVGLGVGFYQNTVPTVYELLERPDGTEIEQDLKLRVVPLTATVKFVPTGRTSTFQPYLGAGVAALVWRYSEVGEFVDPVDFSIFRESYEASGTEVAPIVFGGVRAPITGNAMLGGEVRYQWAEGDLTGDDEFLGDTIDLGGLTVQATLTWLF